MSLNEIRNVVLLLSSPFTNGLILPSGLAQSVSDISPGLIASNSLVGNTTTLSATSTPARDGAVVQGLLFVPDLEVDDPCQKLLADYVPENVTRRNDLPPANYNMVALVPWINPGCTESYLKAVRQTTIRAMLVYLPSADMSSPPPASDSTWTLPSGDWWKTENRHPVYAVPGAWGLATMTQLSLYSGNLTEVPFGSNITDNFNPHPADFVRVWTQLTVGRPEDSLDLWVFMLIVIGLVVFIVGGTMISMRWVRHCRRESLRRRVKEGDVNLEAHGVQRLRVPLDHVKSFPLFLYDYEDVWLSKQLSKAARQADGHAHNVDLHISHQPCCQICVENFVSKKSVIRELPCGHIFHQECIDDFLSEISSLCPVCKSSMLPRGFCPPVTDAMVRREMASRKARALLIPDTNPSSRSRRLRPDGPSRTTSWSDALSRTSTAVGQPLGR